MKEKRTSHPTSVRLTDSEKELLKGLVKYFETISASKVNESDVMRLALRELAERKDIQAKQKGD